MTHSDRKGTGEKKSPVSFKKSPFNHLLYPAAVINSKSVIEYANESFCQLFDIELSKERFDWPASFGSEHKKIVAQNYAKALNGAFSNCRVEVLTPGNDPLVTDFYMQPFSVNGEIKSVMVQVRPVLEHGKSGEIPSETEHETFSNSCFEYSPLPMMRFNRDTELLNCNGSFEGVFGFNAEELSGEGGGINSIFKYDSEKIKNQIIDVVKGNTPFKRIGEIKVRTSEGEERLVNLTIYPIMVDKEVTSVDLVMEDITKVRELKERLSSVKRLNLISDIGKGFLQSIANTVNIILNHTQLLLLLSEKNSVSEGLELIEKYIYQTLEQLRRITGFLNERRDSQDEKKEPFDIILNDALEFAKIHFKIEESKKKREVTLEKLPGMEFSVKTDTIFLRELIVWAILKVSAYAGKKGNIEIDVKKASFVFLTVSVSKTGSVDKENIVPFTFDGFSPSDIRNAAEKLNLKILEEESGDQYSIKIILPHKMIIENGGIFNGGKPDYKVVDKDILIVVPEKTLQIILGNLFERMGNRVVVADESNSALEEFKRKDYDLVIADYEIREFTGIEFAARVKEINEGTITALLSERAIDMKLHSGVIDIYISKPFNIEDLVKEISNFNMLKVYTVR